jgi:sugar phosphate isomerase/epimerase
VDSFTLFRVGLAPALVRDLPPGAVGWLRVGDAGAGDDGRPSFAARLLPGQGGLDIAGVLRACRANGYTGPVSVEGRTADFARRTPAQRASAAYDAARAYFSAAA